MRATRLFGIGLSAAMVAAAAGQAPFTPGNLVVSQIYDGTTVLSAATNAAPMLLVELNITTGAVVQTIALPTAAAGANHAITNRGTSTSIGHLNRSGDRRFVSLMGFDVPVNSPNPSATQAATVGRVVALVNFNAVIDTTTALTDAYDSSSGNQDPRGAYTSNGTDIFMSGVGFPATSGGARYTTLGATTSTAISTQPSNLRCMRVFNGQWYVTSASGSFQGVSAVGTGLPTTTGQATILLPGFPTSAGPSSYDFFFADANTVYVADDTNLNPTLPATPGGIRKWTFDSGTNAWILAYTMNTGLTNGCRGIVGRHTKAGNTLWATTADAIPLVVTVVDTGVASAFTTLATSPAPTGTAAQPLYRGIDFVPEGATPVACYPNCDQSTTNPCLNVLDFSCFLNKFAANDTYANCDQSTTPPVLNVLDFSCFLNQFAAGCSAC